MVNFTKLRKEIQAYDEAREILIKKSRDVLKLSKQVIYAVHRDELDNAATLVKEMEAEKKQLDKIATHSPDMPCEGSYRIAVQEYVEAALYYEFVKNGTLPDIDVDAELFILGLADLTGELVRKAVFLAGKGAIDKVTKIRDEIDQIYGELLKLDVRDNESRRKIDAVKYDLRKMEDLVLDLNLKRR